MKTKEEIDELYHKYWDDFSSEYDDNLHYYSFVEGYLQCQEDMADKKYTEGDRIMKFLDNEKHLGISDKKTIERIKWYFENYFEQFKNNKQD